MKKTAIVIIIALLSLSVSAQRMCSGEYSFPSNVLVNGTLKVANTLLSTVGLLTLKSPADISFFSAENEQMRITSNGVGIGTPNPTQKLDVNGAVKGTSLCIGTDCRTSWPSGGTSGITTESDPTVQSFAKQSTPTLPSGTSVAGNLNVNGQLSTTTLTVGGQAARIPTHVTNSCNSGTCSASCPSGKQIIQGWFFHGNSATNNIHPSSWSCGAAISWMGQCIGQTSCTATAGCSTSSMYLLCA